MGPGRQREEGPTTRRCPTRPTRIQPFRSRQSSVSRARILCARGVAWRRGCVAWRVGCGGEEAGVRHGAGAEVAQKKPKQVRARALAAGA